MKQRTFKGLPLFLHPLPFPVPMKYLNIILVAFSLILLIAAGGLLGSCTEEDLNTEPSFRLSFSNDTVIFDTVFTSVGTAIKHFTVRNESNKRITISSVKLARGSGSPFRINIDGEASFEVKDLEIAANDSAFIFVKVTIDPKDLASPMIETDSVVFITNGNQQNVKLVAWGQDAHFYHHDTLQGNMVLDSLKPHVIYSNLVADPSCILSIEAGAKLHFHLNSGIIIRNGATIKVNGTLEHPVLFRGDRLDAEYSGVPGQWTGIRIEGNSSGNIFNYADIRNGRIGVLLDSSFVGTEPKVIFNSCIIHNMVNYGILSIHSSILAVNSQITNSGGYTVAIEGGGKCEFRQCTISNFWSSSSKQFSTLLLSNSLGISGSPVPVPLEDAYFGNCIITGNGPEEIDLDNNPGAELNFRFDHCLVQTDLSSAYPDSFIQCKVNEEPKLIDPWNGYFELDTLSPAKDAGWLPVIDSSPLDIKTDLKGKSRLIDLGPDLGCYERIEKM